MGIQRTFLHTSVTNKQVTIKRNNLDPHRIIEKVTDILAEIYTMFAHTVFNNAYHRVCIENMASMSVINHVILHNPHHLCICTHPTVLDRLSCRCLNL